MPYASASGRSLERAPHRTPCRHGLAAAAGKDERGDMTRLRGALPPVVSVLSHVIPADDADPAL